MKKVLPFLKKLSANNNKSWFDENRNLYDAAKEEMLEFAAEMIKKLSSIELGMELISPKQTIFRINRDVRFSKNKDPYKNNMGAYFNAGGKKDIGGGYYIHIQPGNCFMGAGIWHPEKEVLGKIRQEIDYNLPEWKKILKAKSLQSHFPNGLSEEDKLVRPPKGYDEENPAINFLKLKSFIVHKTLSDKEVEATDFSKNTYADCKAVKPYLDFINRAARS